MLSPFIGWFIPKMFSKKLSMETKVFIISFPATIQQRILVLILFLFSHLLLLQSAPSKMFTRVLVASLPFVFTFYRGFYIEGFHRSTLREAVKEQDCSKLKFRSSVLKKLVEDCFPFLNNCNQIFPNRPKYFQSQQ